MRIALLAERYAPDLGGADRRVADWATWLAGRGHKVDLLVFDARADAPADIAISRVDGSGAPLARAERLEAAGRATGADLLHDLGAGLGGDVFQPVAPDAGRRGGPARSLDGLRAGRCAVAVAGSARTAEELRRLNGSVDARVLPPGIDLGRFRPVDPGDRAAERGRQRWSEGHVVVLTVDRSSGFARIAAAARAAARARRHRIDARLAVVGRFAEGRLRRGLAAAVGFGAVRFIGEEPDLDRLRAAADIFLQTADDDCGDLCLAAMASGLPVILPRSDPAAGLVTDGVQGWVLENPNDAVELAWRIRNLGRLGLRGAVAAQARALAEHHDRERPFRMLEAICSEAACRRRVPAPHGAPRAGSPPA